MTREWASQVAKPLLWYLTCSAFVGQDSYPGILAVARAPEAGYVPAVGVPDPNDLEMKRKIGGNTAAVLGEGGAAKGSWEVEAALKTAVAGADCPVWTSRSSSCFGSEGKVASGSMARGVANWCSPAAVHRRKGSASRVATAYHPTLGARRSVHFAMSGRVRSLEGVHGRAESGCTGHGGAKRLEAVETGGDETAVDGARTPFKGRFGVGLRPAAVRLGVCNKSLELEYGKALSGDVG